MMTLTGTLHGSTAEGVKIVELPLRGSPIVMDLILPAPSSTMTRFEKDALTAANLTKWLSNLREQRVRLRLPRFQVATQADLAEDLAALGMRDAFTAKADFSRLTASKQFALSRVVHRATVQVQEEGLAASAATGTTFGPRSFALSPDLEFVADRPFLFLIRDHQSGMVLFLGRVSEPAEAPAEPGSPSPVPASIRQ
jgi:serpin B